MLVPNASGALFGLYYTKVFMANHKGSLAKELAVGASLAGTAVAGALAMGVEAAPYIGYVGCGVAVFLMASPLATMATVIREKSTRAMPFAISLVRKTKTEKERERERAGGGGDGCCCCCKRVRVHVC